MFLLIKYKVGRDSGFLSGAWVLASLTPQDSELNAYERWGSEGKKLTQEHYPYIFLVFYAKGKK